MMKTLIYTFIVCLMITSCNITEWDYSEMSFEFVDSNIELTLPVGHIDTVFYEIINETKTKGTEDFYSSGGYVNIAVSDASICSVIEFTNNYVVVESYNFGEVQIVLNAYKYDWVAFKNIFINVPVHANKIAYQQKSGWYSDICIINEDGSGFINLTNTPEKNEKMPSLNYSGELVGYLAFNGSEYDVVIADMMNNVVLQLDNGVSYQSVEFLLDRDVFGCLGSDYTTIDFWKLDGSDYPFAGFSDQAYPYMHQMKINYISAQNESSGAYIRSIYGPYVFENNQHVLYDNILHYSSVVLFSYDVISYPCKAADSSFIVYSRGYGNNSEIVKYHYDQDLQQGFFEDLTDNNFADEHPRIDPLSKRIVFSSNRTGNFDLFIMDADGENVVQITSSPEDDINPDWK